MFFLLSLQFSVLHLCASQIELGGAIEYLLNQYHFDVNILDDDFRSPLHYAVAGNNIEGAAILINGGEYGTDKRVFLNLSPHIIFLPRTLLLQTSLLAEYSLYCLKNLYSNSQFPFSHGVAIAVKTLSKDKKK